VGISRTSSQCVYRYNGVSLVIGYRYKEGVGFGYRCGFGYRYNSVGVSMNWTPSQWTSQQVGVGVGWDACVRACVEEGIWLCRGDWVACVCVCVCACQNCIPADTATGGCGCGRNSKCG
jgi:hypothetical protein